MRVCEIFKSIQGESTWQGMPCAFVRLSGCNLSCTYCDTGYARTGGREQPITEILSTVRSLACPVVELTGGEPLIQIESIKLIKALLDEDYTVLVETNGSVNIKDIDKRAIIILDIKSPGSGMYDRMDTSNLIHIKPSDEVKFVLVDRADYDWARGFITMYGLESKCKVLFSPVFGRLEPAKLAEWILEDGLRVRMNLQIHKYIWAPDRRGV